MILRKKPLKWVSGGEFGSVHSDNGLYEVQPIAHRKFPCCHLWYLDNLSQHSSIEAAKEAAEEHWAAVVPPGCERVELCRGYDLEYCCPDCDGSGVVEVK